MYATRNIGDEGLNPTEVDLLRHLATQGPRNQQAISEYLQIDKAAITRILRRLEKNGYVKRLPDTKDARTKIVTVTDAGKNIKGNAAKAEDYFYDWMLEPFSPKDLEVFKELVQILFTRANDSLQTRFASIPPADAP